MGLPTAVKNKANMARLLHEQNNTDSSPAAPIAPRPATTDSAPAQPPADSQKVDELVESQPAPVAPPVEPLMDYETRYKNMRAKGDIRSKELSAKLEVAQSRINELEAEVERLKSAAPVSNSKQGVLSDEDREDLGEDAADVIEKLNASYQAKIAELEASIDSHNAQPNQVVEKPAANGMEREFYAELDKLSPKWKEANADKHFFAWLAQIDDATGNPRQADLDLAQDAFDAVSVARFVNTYMAQRPVESSVVEPNTSRATDYVAPGTATPQGFEMVYSGAEVKDFYNRKSAYNRRAMAGNVSAEEGAALDAEEAQIKLAFAEGRVQD